MAGVILSAGISALAGCGQQYIVPIDWTVDLSNPIELRGCYPLTGTGAFGRDDSAKIIKETTGYTVKYEELGSNADNDVAKYLSTQEKFHFMKLTEAQYHPNLAKGNFCDLTDILQNTESGRILYQLIDLMDYGWEAVTYVDDEGNSHIYGIPDFGYVSMIDSAMVWNRDHLKQIGFTERYPDTENGLPETVEQVTWALKTCQEYFGKNNNSYHALGIPGANAVEIVQLKGAFEVPNQFYVDDDGNIQQYVYSENTTNYTVYMNKLFKNNILSSAWQGESQASMHSKFADELFSCVFTSYWHVITLVNTIVARTKIAESMGIENTYQNMHDQAIGWQLRVRGDGTGFDDSEQGRSVNQDVARIEGGGAGVSYYTVIPAYMSDKALYVVDFLSKKLQYFADYYGGTEGLHWNVVDAPAGAPAAADYTEENDAEYTKYENLKEKLIFLRPYEYSYTRYYNTEEVTDNKLVPETMGEEKINVSQPGRWVKLTDRYKDQIADNSQYCNGTNAVEARVLFHLRETGFDAWPVVTPTDDTIIFNPMSMSPPIKHWAPISILSRTKLKNGICSAIEQDDPVTSLNNTRQGVREQYDRGADGEKYYYWSDTISEEMTKWYKEVKLNRD